MSYENFIGKQEKFTENINEKQVQRIVATLQSKQLKMVMLFHVFGNGAFLMKH